MHGESVTGGRREVPTAAGAAATRERGPVRTGRGDRSGRLAGVALMLGSATSNQTGAAVGALAFPLIGPAAVVAVRQWVAAAVLLTTGRPRWRTFTAAHWRLVAALAVVMATMNLSLYEAIDRIGLGLGVTLEFLGPLAVALAGSRRRLDLVCALAVGAAVVVLTRPQPSSDYVGIGLALLAAACWACYILLNRAMGVRVPGTQGTAAAAALSGLMYVPVGIVALARHPFSMVAIGCAVTTGVLSSAVPFVCDLLTLRRIPARLFGIFMSVNPVVAALLGIAVLGQHLPLSAWVAILVIVTANALALAIRTAPAEAPSTRQTPPSGAPIRRTGRGGWPDPQVVDIATSDAEQLDLDDDQPDPDYRGSSPR